VQTVASLANPLAGSDLAAFVLAVEAASIQGAADALELTQSAVTKRVQALERRVGARLLERGRFGVRPTELGRAVYPQAKLALASLETVALTASTAPGAADELQLVSSLTIGEFLLPGWLAEFRRARPDVHTQLELINTRAVLDAIRGDRRPVGFVEGLDALDGLRVLTLARDEIVVAVGPEHPWRHRRSVRARDLKNDAYLTRETTSGTRAVADAALAAVGIALEPELQMASNQSLKRALVGGGFTLISRLAIEDEQRSGALVGLSVRDVDLTRELSAIARTRPALTGAARSFWRWLSQRIDSRPMP
jgi:DNA-binding transcriptional LysR family regulator